MVVAYKTEIGYHILYLLALVERKTAIYAVREGAFAEGLLKNTRLRVGAVEHGNIAEVEPLAAAQFGNLIGDNLALLKIGICRADGKRRSHGTLRIYGFLYLMRIFSYKAVGRIHYHLCGAVILLQLEYLSPFIALGKTKNIANIGTAEGVYALRIVAHHAHSLALLGELPHNCRLQEVGILILIHKQITELAHILFAHLGELLEQPVRVEQQVVEIHSIGLFAALAIAAVYITGIGNARTLVIT